MQKVAADPRSKPHATLPHLFLFIACCGLYLAAARALNRQALESPTLFGLALVAAHGLCTAAAWTALGLLIVRLVRGARWPIDPGFMLAAILGVRLALEVLLSLPARPLFQSTEAILDVTTCLLLVFPLFGRLPVRWQVIMTCLLLLYALPLLVTFANSEVSPWLVQIGRPLVIVVLLVLGIFLDRRSGDSFIWLHWLGVLSWVLFSFVTLSITAMAGM